MDILDSKERRAKIQKDLIRKYNKALISFTLNIPGKIKDTPTYRDIHMEGVRIIEESLNKRNWPILFKKEIENTSGREAYLIVDIDANRLKNIAIDIEESDLIARIFDIDVFDKNHQQISRIDLGVNPRRCLLCSLDARICMRMKNHTYEDLLKEINNIWVDYRLNKI